MLAVAVRALVIASLAGLIPAAAAQPSKAVAAGAGKLAATNPPRVRKWLKSRGRECGGRGKYRRFCQGPRRAPAPYGKAKRRAQRLGLGTDKAMRHLLLRAPKPEWVVAAGGRASDVKGKNPQPLAWPVPDGKQWRGFGRDTRRKRRKGRHKWHKGVDIGAPKGTAIHAAQRGIVAYADNGIRGYGNLLTVVHQDGTVGMYAHCTAIYVFPGQRVDQGQRVADVGHTGIAYGSHLHFEYRRRGRPRNPARLFKDAPEDPRKKRRRQRAERRRKRQRDRKHKR